MIISRRFQFCFALLFVLLCALPAHAAEKAKIGYLHTPAVDSQLWIGQDKGYFAEQGLAPELVKFTSGVAMMEALKSGTVDVAIMGAVISNFPAKGIGKLFMINSIEFDTAMLFARPEAGVKDFAEIKGKKIYTTKGTTAHVFLHTALKKNGVDSVKDVTVEHLGMGDVVDGFISGKNPIIATWSPHHVRIWNEVPDSVMLSSAKDYYPDAAILGGWVATNEYYEKNKEGLRKMIRAWAKANDYLVENPTEAIKLIHTIAYSGVPFEDIQASWDASMYLPSSEWLKLYESGKASEWVGKVQKTFVEIGVLDKVVEPASFFDTELFISEIKK